MNKNLNEYISTYKKLLDKGDIQIAYDQLLKYVMALKVHFQKVKPSYTFGTVFLGFMDYTYFYFFNDFLRNKKLRFGIVLNHPKMQFELWLMGQNTDVQAKYWELLKNSKWNKDKTAKPQYAELEAIIVSNPNFDDLENLTKEIEEKTVCMVAEILDYLKNLD